jgi:hypothetical protein
MLKNKMIFLASLVVVSLALAACQTNNPTEPTSPSLNLTVIAPTLASGYPAPGQNNAAYPAPLQTEPTKVIEPAVDATPDPEMGNVSGVLQLLQDGSANPVPGQALYLAKVLVGSDGEERAAAFDQQTAPRAVTDDLGAFRFINVPPGRYGIVMDIVIESFLLNDPNTGLSLLITVNSGEEVEMGELLFTSLPLPSP